MSNKRLVFDPDLLYRVAKYECVRDKFVSDNYERILAAFRAAIRSYRLPSQTREDILAESIVKLFEALGDSMLFKPERIKDGDLGTWALSIPINKARDFLDSPRAPKYHTSYEAVNDAAAAAEAAGANGGAAWRGLEDNPRADSGAPPSVKGRAPNSFVTPGPDDDGNARVVGDDITRLVDLYGNARVEAIAALRGRGYKLKEIAVKLGLSYSNTRVTWTRFAEKVRAAGEKLDEV